MSAVGAAFGTIEALLQRPDQDFEQEFCSKKASFTGGLSIGLSYGYKLGQQQGLKQRLDGTTQLQPQVLQCKGLQSGIDGIGHLFTVAVGELNEAGNPVGHGNWSVEYLWAAGLGRHPDLGQYPTLRSFHEADPEHYEQLQNDCAALTANKKTALWLYHATGSSLRSTACFGQTTNSDGTCDCCHQLKHEGSIRLRARRKIEEPDEGCHTPMKCNIRHQTSADKTRAMEQARDTVKQARASDIKSNRASKRDKQRLATAINKAKDGAEQKNYDEFLQNLLLAHDIAEQTGEPFGGGLMSTSLNEILTSISTAVRNGTTRGRKLKKNERLFYAALLNTKGPWTHDLVSGILLGPHLRTTKRARSELASGFCAQWCEQSVANLLEVLEEFGLDGVPGILSEDGTSILRRLDLERVMSKLHISPSGLEVHVHGLNGQPRVIHSKEELKALASTLSEDDIASTLYVWLWVPQADHAPW